MTDVPRVPRSSKPPQLFDVGEKPPYRVPLLEEISKIKPNGFTVVSTFAGAGGSSTGYRLAGFNVLWANEFVPIAQESYRANCAPHTVVDGRSIKDVTAADILRATGLKRGELDVFDGSPPCFVAGTLILTRRGLLPIEQVREGDMVVTHEARWRRVTARMERAAETVSVRGQGHPGIGTTLEHPFLVRRVGSAWDNAARTNLRAFGAPEWRPIGGCSPNGEKGSKAASFFWSMPRTFPDDAIPRVSRASARSAAVEMTPTFFWLVGLWLGDGWLRTGRAHVGTSSRGEVLICANKDQAAEVRGRIDAAGLPFSEAEMRTTTRFTICHAGLADWLEEDFGRGADHKTVASWAFGMPEAWRQALLDGYFFADGTAPREGYRRATSVSWSLILGMAMLARSLGVATSLRCQTYAANAVIENRKVNVAGATYALDCYDKPRSFLIEQDRCWGKIKQVNPGGRTMVYNISVEEDESYLADGLIVHNCQAFSTAGRREKGWGTERTYEHGASQKNEELFFDYIRLRDGLMPRVFVAENVAGLVKGTAKGFFLEILKELRRGYRVVCPLLDAQWLGVPQARQRIVFIGVRDDVGLDPPKITPLPYRYSVRDALPWLDQVVHDTRGQPQFSAGTITDRPAPTIMSSAYDSHHFKAQPKITRGNSGGGWKNEGKEIRIDECSPTVVAGKKGSGPHSFIVHDVVHDTGRKNAKAVSISDRPSTTIVASQHSIAQYQVVGTSNAPHKGKNKKHPLNEPIDTLMSRRTNLQLEGPSRRLVGVGGRGGFGNVVISPADGPAATFGTSPSAGNGLNPSGEVYEEVGGVTEKRKFTILEVKRLCGFSDDYILKGTYGQQWERLGNSVPPPMMMHIAAAIRDRVLLPWKAKCAELQWSVSGPKSKSAPGTNAGHGRRRSRAAATDTSGTVQSESTSPRMSSSSKKSLAGGSAKANEASTHATTGRAATRITFSRERKKTTSRT